MAGALFGSALVTKQFALLVLIPALVAVPTRRERVQVAAIAAVVGAVVVAPFVAVAPMRTLENLVGIGSAGAVKGATIAGLLDVSATAESVIARGAPIVLALALAAFALRSGDDLSRKPARVLGLTLACLAGRLVFESVMIPYYLLATSVVFVLVDLARRQVPARSFAWIAATATFVVLPIHSKPVDAIGTLALTAIALAVGLHDFAARNGAKPVVAAAVPSPALASGS
jgi:uncharacterized membrane protein